MVRDDRGRAPLRCPREATMDLLDSAPRFAPGQLLGGKYRVEREIGRGGMGVVLEATQLPLQRRVAVKLLAREHPGASAYERFVREAEVVSSLDNEHVVRLLDFGTEQGDPFLVMEHLQGEDLAVCLRRRRQLTVVDAASYLVQACEGLAEAHAKGIVHRDLKPSNLFLTRRRDGSTLVKVLDFGISKVLDAGRAELTATIGTLGTAAYMSPEQVQSPKFVDQRTDLWSLGVILYEALSGDLPFQGLTPIAVGVSVVSRTPRPLAALRPGLPPGLVAIVDRCLLKPREDRYQSIDELCDALRPFARPNQAPLSSEEATQEMPVASFHVPRIHHTTDSDDDRAQTRVLPGPAPTPITTDSGETRPRAPLPPPDPALRPSSSRPPPPLPASASRLPGPLAASRPVPSSPRAASAGLSSSPVADRRAIPAWVFWLAALTGFFFLLAVGLVGLVLRRLLIVVRVVEEDLAEALLDGAALELLDEDLEDIEARGRQEELVLGDGGHAGEVGAQLVDLVLLDDEARVEGLVLDADAQRGRRDVEGREGEEHGAEAQLPAGHVVADRVPPAVVRAAHHLAEVGADHASQKPPGLGPLAGLGGRGLDVMIQERKRLGRVIKAGSDRAHDVRNAGFSQLGDDLGDSVGHGRPLLVAAGRRGRPPGAFPRRAVSSAP
jgi:serine/threonine-protein kinase